MRNTVTAAALVLASAVAAAADDPVEMNVSTFVPENHPLARYSYTEWLPRLAEASDGTIRAQLFSSGSLLAAASHLSGLRDGIIQLGFVAGTYTPSDLPEDNTLAYLAFNRSDPFAAAFAMTEANIAMPALAAQWDRFDVVYLGGYSTPVYNMICRDEVTTLSALSGKKVRAPGAAYSAWLESEGAVPVNVPTSEMYSGLDKGIIDCTLVPADEVVSRSLSEVASHVTMVELGVYDSGAKYAVSGAFWSGLSTQQRQAFIDTIPQGIVDELQFYVGQTDSAVASAGDLGITVSDPAEDMAASVESFKSEVRAGAVAVGADQFGLDDPEALIAEFEAIYAKWEDLLADVDRDDDAALIALLQDEVFAKIDTAAYGVN